MPLGPLYILLGEVSVQVLCPFFNWIVCLVPLVGVLTDAATVENSMEFPQKLKMDLPFDPVISLLGLYLKNPETPIQKNVCTQMFIAAQFTIAKCWKQPK